MGEPTMNLRRALASGCVLVVVLAAVLTSCEQKGPSPTEASVTATTGPFAIRTVTVGAGNGFGGGTIYAPTDTSQGAYGGVAVAARVPRDAVGHLVARTSNRHPGVRRVHDRHQLDVRLPDRPGDRDARRPDYLSTSSAVLRGRPARLAVVGHSMGAAARSKPPAMNQTCGPPSRSPGTRRPNFSANETPTLIVAARTTRSPRRPARQAVLQQHHHRQGVPGDRRRQPLA